MNLYKYIHYTVKYTGIHCIVYYTNFNRLYAMYISELYVLIYTQKN